MDFKIVLLLLCCLIGKTVVAGHLKSEPKTSINYGGDSVEDDGKVATSVPANPVTGSWRAIMRSLAASSKQQQGTEVGPRFRLLRADATAAGILVGQLRCYACSFSSVDSDQSCLTITEDTRTVECRYTYCTILRQEFLDPTGVVASFTRGCEEEPDFLNHEITDSTFRTFYRACTGDLCNIGNGVQSIVGGNLSPTPEYNGENLLVPGTGGAANLKLSLFLLVLCTFVMNM